MSAAPTAPAGHGSQYAPRISMGQHPVLHGSQSINERIALRDALSVSRDRGIAGLRAPSARLCTNGLSLSRSLNRSTSNKWRFVVIVSTKLGRRRAPFC